MYNILSGSERTTITTLYHCTNKYSCKLGSGPTWSEWYFVDRLSCKCILSISIRSTIRSSDVKSFPGKAKLSHSKRTFNNAREVVF